MTVTVTNIVAGPFVATGDEQVIPFDFKVFTPGEVEVLVGADRVVLDPETYIVTPNRAIDGQVLEGGTITFLDGALMAGDTFRAVAKPAKTQELVFSDTGSRLHNLNEVADRAALRAIRAQYDGALEGAGAELIEAATEAGAAAGIAAGLSKADRSGGNLSTSEAISFREKLKQFFITPEDYGAVPNDISFDNAAAINAAEAAAEAAGVAVRFREGADYYFKSTIGGARDRLVWQGNRTRLIYNGASTTINLVELGDGTNIYVEQEIEGLEICSRTVMTAGAAVWAPKVARSNHRFDNIQGQDFGEEMVAAGIAADFHGVTLHGGYFADAVDNVRLWADAINAREYGWRVVGRAGSPQADFWPFVGKVSWAKIGGHVAGGFGGVYIGQNTTFIHNRVNLQVDRSVVNEPNREVFAKGTTFDVAEGNNLTTDANIVIDDVSNVRIDFVGCWISAGQSHGVWVKKHQGVMTFVGNRVIQMVGDGFRTDQAGSSFTLMVGNQITNNGGWGINGRVNNHSLSIGDNKLFSNAAGDINPAFINTGFTQSGASDFQKVTSREIVADGFNGVTAKFGFISDLYFYITRLGKDVNGVGGDPQFNYDDQDYDVYRRADNRREMYVGNTRIGYFTGDGYLSLGGGAEVQTKLVVTTTDASGNVLVAHGVTSGANRILSVTVRVGADGASKTMFNANWDGTNIGVNGTGQNNTKAVVTMLVARNDA